MKKIRVLFSPDKENPDLLFVEVENEDGHSMSPEQFGAEWVDYLGYRVLEIDVDKLSEHKAKP